MKTLTHTQPRIALSLTIRQTNAAGQEIVDARPIITQLWLITLILRVHLTVNRVQFRLGKFRARIEQGVEAIRGLFDVSKMFDIGILATG